MTLISKLCCPSEIILEQVWAGATSLQLQYIMSISSSENVQHECSKFEQVFFYDEEFFKHCLVIGNFFCRSGCLPRAVLKTHSLGTLVGS